MFSSLKNATLPKPAPSGEELASQLLAEKEALRTRASEVQNVLASEIEGDEFYVEERRKSLESLVQNVSSRNSARQSSISALAQI